MELQISGYAVLIDDEDFERISKIKWTCYGIRGHNLKPYIVSTSLVDGKISALHRVVMGLHKTDLEIDHINGDTLDNRKSNLRVCPRGMYNAINRGKQRNNTSGYKGVFLRKDTAIPKYRAQLRYKQKLVAFGQYNDPKYAASVYDYACSLLFGEFANLNNTGVQVTEEDKLKIEAIVEKQNHDYTYIPKKLRNKA